MNSLDIYLIVMLILISIFGLVERKGGSYILGSFVLVLILVELMKARDALNAIASGL